MYREGDTMNTNLKVKIIETAGYVGELEEKVNSFIAGKIVIGVELATFYKVVSNVKEASTVAIVTYRD